MCGLASDERMMDAKYLNHKFKLFPFYEMFLVINHVELNGVSLKNYHFVLRFKFVKVNLVFTRLKNRQIIMKLYFKNQFIFPYYININIFIIYTFLINI